MYFFAVNLKFFVNFLKKGFVCKKNKQTEVFSTLVQQRKLTEWVFERDLGAKTLLNNLTSDAGLNLGRLFAL